MKLDEFVMVGKSSRFHRNFIGKVVKGIFGGGGGDAPDPYVPPEVIKPHLGPRGKDWREWNYGQIRSGLAGEGMAPAGFYSMLQRTQGFETRKGFHKARQDLNLGMVGQRRDKKAANFARRSLQQSHQVAQDDMRQGIKEAKAQDRGLARAAAADMAAGARGIASAQAGAYNNQMLQMRALEMSQGNFYSNLFEGIGEGAGWGMTGMTYANAMAKKPGY
jgi:hypothetical protein